MKRIVSVILSAIIVLGLVGCGDKKDGETSLSVEDALPHIDVDDYTVYTSFSDVIDKAAVGDNIICRGVIESADDMSFDDSESVWIYKIVFSGNEDPTYVNYDMTEFPPSKKPDKGDSVIVAGKLRKVLNEYLTPPEYVLTMDADYITVSNSSVRADE